MSKILISTSPSEELIEQENSLGTRKKNGPIVALLLDKQPRFAVHRHAHQLKNIDHKTDYITKDSCREWKANTAGSTPCI